MYVGPAYKRERKKHHAVLQLLKRQIKFQRQFHENNATLIYVSIISNKKMCHPSMLLKRKSTNLKLDRKSILFAVA